MNTKVYNDLRALGCKVAIGGSGSLYLQGLTTKLPGDLDLVLLDMGQLPIIESYFKEAEVMFWFPNSKGFNLYKQWKMNGEKFDLFIADTSCPTVVMTGKVCITDSMIWAARGYYAAGSTNDKYRDQLVAEGFWPESRKPSMITRYRQESLWQHFLRVVCG